MTPEPVHSLDHFRLVGARLRKEGPKAYGAHRAELEDWSIVSRTFGFFQWKTKNSITPEQLAAIEDGFKNYEAVSRAK